LTGGTAGSFLITEHCPGSTNRPFSADQYAFSEGEIEHCGLSVFGKMNVRVILRGAV